MRPDWLKRIFQAKETPQSIRDQIVSIVATEQGVSREAVSDDTVLGPSFARIVPQVALLSHGVIHGQANTTVGGLIAKLT